MTLEKLTLCSLNYGTFRVCPVSCDGNMVYNPSEQKTLLSSCVSFSKHISHQKMKGIGMQLIAEIKWL